ncbi:MAG: winged helix-turn-helix domain-containing protein [Gammaproteobacteria bacterium]|nr:winged helix-turn-helix domain-containing protein [Gammaproteobacteria bacterium]MBT4493679.1 winged helix-turn-helix domain-containing protein [Gammaproteobacteria bacterium]
MELGKRDARKLFMKQQGLLHDSEFGRGKHAVHRAIDRLSYLQIDTISVVSRAHQHIIQSRVDNIEISHLNGLMLDRQLYEYWSHAAAFLPFEDYRYSIPVMNGWQSTRSHDKKLAKSIMSRIRTEGPLQSRDFEAPAGHKSGGWWKWKPAKQVLEYLFLTGDLMVSHREGFQKVFDLRENIIPSHIDTREPSTKEWSEFIVRRMINALGIATEYDIGYAKSTIRRLAKIALGEPIKQSLAHLVSEGELVEVDVDGRRHYSTHQLLDQLPLRSSRKAVKLLSPFDNLVINRRRTNELFNFDYQLECYLPERKRKYGYFALPMLYGDQLIGRLDAKVDRKVRTLTLRNLVLEESTRIDDALLNSLITGIRRFAVDHNCLNIKLEKCSPASLRRLLVVQL